MNATRITARSSGRAGVVEIGGSTRGISYGQLRGAYSRVRAITDFHGSSNRANGAKSTELVRPLLLNQCR
jgi:hypothetical protein